MLNEFVVETDRVIADGDGVHVKDFFGEDFGELVFLDSLFKSFLRSDFCR